MAADEHASALEVARRAAREAGEAREHAEAMREHAQDSARSLYRALGEVAHEVQRLSGGVGHLTEMVGRMMTARGISVPPPPLPPMRERAPSSAELAEVAETAAARALEKTGSVVLPERKVVSIFERQRNAQIVSIGAKVLLALLPLLAGLVLGHLAWK